MNNNNDEIIIANLLKDFKGTFEELNNTMIHIQTSMLEENKDRDRTYNTFKWLIGAMAIIFMIMGAPMFMWFYSMVDDMNSMSQSMGVMTENVTKMSNNLDKMSNDMHQMLGKINSMSIDMKTMSGDMGNMSQDMKQMSTDMRDMRYATVSMNNGLNNMTRSMGVMTRDVNQMSNTVSPTMDGMRQLMLFIPWTNVPR